MDLSLQRRLASELLGSTFLLMAVVGSGIMAQRLFDNEGLTLLANSIATGGALIALILTFSGISGAHFNPAVTLSAVLQKSMTWKQGAAYAVAQSAGAVFGVALAHWMFGLPTFLPSWHERAGIGVLLGEGVATFGLIGVVIACSQRDRSNTSLQTSSPAPSHAPYAVAGFIVAGYWFTSSTSFANPAVTLARSLTDTFTGISYESVHGFILAQFIAAVVGTFLFRWLFGAGKDQGQK